MNWYTAKQLRIGKVKTLVFEKKISALMTSYSKIYIGFIWRLSPSSGLKNTLYTDWQTRSTLQMTFSHREYTKF